MVRVYQKTYGYTLRGDNASLDGKGVFLHDGALGLVISVVSDRTQEDKCFVLFGDRPLWIWEESLKIEK